MTINSAIANGELHLQGTYLSIGVNADGNLGTTKNAPKGFATDADSGFLRVGMFADLDGFGQGKATTLDDVLLQGRSIEGFNVGYTIGSNKVVQSNQLLTGYYQIKGTLSDASTAEEGKAVWNGATKDKLGIAQTITLADDAKYIKIDVTLTNNSATTMNDVRYMRTADPDQTGKFDTANKIEQNDGALVTAMLQKDTPFFLYSQDERATASFYGFVNLDPYAATATSQAKGYAKTADQTLNLTFSLGALKAGESTKITLYMGVTDNLKATLAEIDAGKAPVVVAPPVVNLAPEAVNDAFDGDQDNAVTGNVLSNDKDPEGKKLTASMVDGPDHGTIKFSDDGSFIYTPNAGWSGGDSFTYAASDGVHKTNATVDLSIEAAPVVEEPVIELPPVETPVTLPPVTADPFLDLLQAASVFNGNASANEILKGTAGSDVFYFSNEARTGQDRIVGFDKTDLFVTDAKLYDGNNDGIIALSKNKVSLDGGKGGDTVVIEGVSKLRFLGTDDAGHAVYADASARPKNAKEGTTADDAFMGDARNKSKNVFFFDTNHGLDLGNDTIGNFGKHDLVVTTTKLADDNNDGIITISDGKFALPGDTGSLLVSDTKGAAIDSLEFDGSVVRGGLTYYVYSLVGSVGTDASDLSF
ncbi:Ig-like domain-containing protein [Sphingomonas sp. Leaf10]|uniref:Ig-like domain-containing protein n=1 Tax=Sphingomonas sp. Leaf10 TaxID=1735676 RepID=UPI0006F404C4|nr:Ig-like domain-containing protein [Sphingomonas sp. Leaf10]KQM30561.1 hypothetical protein ASE59_08305 [Sphingomonas sp. Leaf10]